MPSTPTLNLLPVKQSPKESLDENKLEQISLNIKRHNSNRKKEMQTPKGTQESLAQRKASPEEKKHVEKKPEEELLVFAKDGPKIEITPATPRLEEPNKAKEEPKPKKEEKKLDVDEASLQRGIERIIKGRKKSKSVARKSLVKNFFRNL